MATQLVRCKACGFIMRESALGDRCPACGVLRNAFELFQDPVAEGRRRILDKDIHTIAVHFPVSFGASLVVLTIGVLIFAGKVEELVIATTKIMSLFTPLLVIAGLLTGMLDGKVRFKKIGRSAILKRKIVLASLFFLFSAALAVLVWLSGMRSTGAVVAAVAAAAVAFAFSIILGLLGSSMTCAAMRGK